MLEKQRRSYLESLGITDYVPRVLLPNAVPSQLLSDALLQEPTAFSTADVAVDTVEDHHPGVVRDDGSVTDVANGSVLENLSASLVADHASTGYVSASPPSANKVTDDTPIGDETSGTLADVESSIDAVKFTLHIWRIKQELLVVDSYQPGSALPTDKLLHNILRSVGYPLAQLPQSELLRWPLFSGGQFAPQSAHDELAEARAMVQAYIAAQCGKIPTKAIIVLGEPAARFVLTPEDEARSFSQCQGRAIRQAQWQTTALVGPSLIDMLQEPLKKPIIWQALQFLLNDG